MADQFRRIGDAVAALRAARKNLALTPLPSKADEDARLTAEANALSAPALAQFFLACVYFVPQKAMKGWYSACKGPMSEAAVCIFIYIETKAALGTSTLWAKATTRGPLTSSP